MQYILFQCVDFYKETKRSGTNITVRLNSGIFFIQFANFYTKKKKKKKTSTKHRGSTVWILFQVVNLFHQSNARFRSLTDWDKTSASCANHGQNKEDNKDKIWIVSKRREKIARHGSHSSPCMCSEFSKSNPKRLYIFSLFYSLICHLTQMAGPRRDIHLHVK